MSIIDFYTVKDQRLFEQVAGVLRDDIPKRITSEINCLLALPCHAETLKLWLAVCEIFVDALKKERSIRGDWIRNFGTDEEKARESALTGQEPL